jgi:hypothetical protein
MVLRSDLAFNAVSEDKSFFTLVVVLSFIFDVSLNSFLLISVVDLCLDRVVRIQALICGSVCRMDL